MLGSARRIAIATLIVCLGAVWTCPVYCATASMHSQDSQGVPSPTAVVATAHEHHHVSATANHDSTNDDGTTLQSAHRDCCGNCGNVDQALLSTAKPEPSALKAGHLAAAMAVTAGAPVALLRGPASPPLHLPHHGPPSPGSAAPLRV
jgi:hypothetical protein